MVFMPPRHGKSEINSKYFPAWYLGLFPDRRVILASYEAAFAASWGRKARDVLEEHGASLFEGLAVRQDSRASDWWEIAGRDGGMVTAGAGGAITGKGAHLLLIDDPIKNAEEAQSKARRESIWDWYQSTAYTRLEPGGAIVLTMTLWHEDDLGGRLLAQMAAGGEQWRVLRFPALAEEADELGRAPGEPLWPARFDVPALERIRSTVGPHVWSALYQQRPMPIGGGLFRREWFRHYERPGLLFDTNDRPITGVLRLADRWVEEASLRRFATVDLAASTKTTADYTVIASWGVEPGPSGALVLLDLDRARREGPDIVPAIRRAVERWGLSAVWVERVGFQLALVQEARRAGLPVRELEADRDKVARALPATADLEGGRVWFPRAGPWLDDLEAEILSFPGGRHDDCVDVLSYAVRVARAHGPIASAEIDPERVMARASERDAREERWAAVEAARAEADRRAEADQRRTGAGESESTPELVPAPESGIAAAAPEDLNVEDLDEAGDGDEVAILHRRLGLVGALGGDGRSGGSRRGLWR